MPKENAAKETAAPIPRFIKLAADWGNYREGRVIFASVDLLATLDVEGIRYTTATDRERQIAGFADQTEA